MLASGASRSGKREWFRGDILTDRILGLEVRFLGLSDDHEIVADCVARTSFAALSGGAPSAPLWTARSSARALSAITVGVHAGWAITVAFTPNGRLRSAVTQDMSALILAELGWSFPLFGWERWAFPPARPRATLRPMPESPRSPNATTRRTRLTAMIVATAMFMQNLDSTVIATALPTMAKVFGYDPQHMSVALTSYLLSLAVFIPASGWVADRYGARNVFRIAIVVFTLGSVLCGQSDSLSFLVCARVLQGLGGAMMVPVGRLLLLRTAAKTELVAAMAWLTTPALLGPVVGPPLGGFIVTYLNWRWIFNVNIPIGILGFVLVTLFIEDVREPPRGRFDMRGLLLTGIALTGLMFGLETLGRGVVPLWATQLMLGAGGSAVLLYILHARSNPTPVLDFTLMKLPCFGVAFTAMMLFRTGIGAIPFLLPMMLQVGFGKEAVESGLITFASSAGALVMKPVTQRALRLFGFRDTLIWNGLFSGVMLAMCATFRPTWPAAAIYGVLLIGGFMRSLQFTAYNTLAYGDVPRPRMSAATSLYTAGQQLAATIGVSAGAVSLQVAGTWSGHLAPQPMDFSVAFLVVGGLTLMAAPVALLMPRTAGDELTGRGRVVGRTGE